jgi:hypothetical protein
VSACEGWKQYAATIERPWFHVAEEASLRSPRWVVRVGADLGDRVDVVDVCAVDATDGRVSCEHGACP